MYPPEQNRKLKLFPLEILIFKEVCYIVPHMAVTQGY